MTGGFRRRATLALLAFGILAAAGCNGGDAVDKTGRGNTVVISTASVIAHQRNWGVRSGSALPPGN